MSSPLLLSLLLAAAPTPASEHAVPVTVEAPVTVDAPLTVDAPISVDAPGTVMPVAIPASSEEADKGIVRGIVKHSNTREAIANAQVTLTCSCLESPLALQTNARGIYSFESLPSGDYQVSVHSELATVHKFVTLPRNAKFRANFSINPDVDQYMTVHVRAEPIDRSPRPRPRELDIDLSTTQLLCIQPLRPRSHRAYRPTQLDRAERHSPTYGLQRSLFDDAGMAELLGQPALRRRLP